MFKRSKVMGGVLVALGGALIVGAGPVWAQGDRVEITGSRIKTLDAVSNSPVSTVTAAEIGSSQPIAVEEVVKTLAAAVPAIGPGTNNGSGGGATIDLRGLGSNRSLVLVNGRRLVPFNLLGSADTNSIPISLLDRMELVTGGASAVYGADAVTGVVNFILRKNFQGFEATGRYGISEQGDAKRTHGEVTLGASLADGRGNVVLSLGKTKSDPLTQGERLLGQRALASTTGNPQGSNTDVPVQFTGVPGAPVDAVGFSQLDLATGRLVPAGSGFNFNPVNYYQTPLDRQQVTALANFVINDHVEAYAELFHTRSDVTQNLAGSGTFLNTYNVPVGNPFMPDALRTQLCQLYRAAELAKAPASQNANLLAATDPANCVSGSTTALTAPGPSALLPLSLGRRFTELGPRIGRFENKTTQWTLGFKGNIIGNWGYDAYFSHGEADQVRTLANWGSLSKVRQALDAVSTTACRNTANGCVPLNVFGADGSITPAMLRFINLDSLQLQTVEQDVMSLSVTGELGKLPTARSPIAVAVGVERRELFAGNKSDSASQIQGEVLGTGAPLPDRSGTVLLKEGFAEVAVPVLEGLPFAHRLTLEGGFRATNFSSGVTNSYNTYKIGGDYAPIRGLRFRGMVQKATRAPSINELFAPQVSGLSNLAVDPCGSTAINQADANTAGTLSNLCRQTGVPLASIGSLSQPSAGQINNLGGGNPALEPEEADTTTIGIVFEPEFAKGLSVSLDFYQIDLTKAISSASVTDILNQCYRAAENPTFSFNAFCALIFRNPLTGTFNGAEARGVFTALSNLGTYKTRGYDLKINYRLALRDLGLDPKWGRVDLGLDYNKVEKLEFQATPAAINRDCNGYYSVACANAFQSPLFKQKFVQRTSWNVGDFTLGYVWRQLGKTVEEPLAPNFLPAFSSIDTRNYIDLNAAWQATKNLRVAMTINNVRDSGAPNVGNTISGTTYNSGNTFPQTYDVIGRYFSLSGTLKF